MRESSAIIDIGSAQIVTLVGENGVNNTLNITGRGDVSYAGFQRGEFLEPENLKFVIATSVSNAEMTSDTKITNVYLGVPGEFCMVITKSIEISFPRPKRILNSDIQNIFKAGNDFSEYKDYSVINHSAIYYELDNSKRVIDPLFMKTKKIKGQISYILAYKSFISIMNSTFAELGINIKGYVSSMLAECLHLFDPKIRDKYVIMVDCGYITTSVVLSRGNALLAMNSFSLGGGYITSDLSQCLKISFNEAERLKHKVLLNWNASPSDTYEIDGDEYKLTYSAKATNEIVTDRIEMICEYIQKCIDNFVYELPEFLPIYITGGGLNFICGIKNIISKKLKRSVELVSVKSMHVARPNDTSEESMLSMMLNYQDILENLIVKV